MFRPRFRTYLELVSDLNHGHEQMIQDSLPKLSLFLNTSRHKDKKIHPQNHRRKTWSETTLTGESRSHISTPLGIWTWVPCDGKQTGSPLDQWDMARIMWDCRLSTGLPPSSRLRQLWSQKGDLQRAWNRDRKSVWSSRSRLTHC